MGNNNIVARGSNFLDAKQAYSIKRIEHWNQAAGSQKPNLFSSYYHRRLEKVYSLYIPPGSKVLEVGCGEGDLLAHLKPAYGVGFDFSENAIERAKIRHPEHKFFCSDASEVNSSLKGDEFDFIILSDLVDDLWDVQSVLQTLTQYSTSRTRVLLNFYSRFWQIPLLVAQKIGLAKSMLLQNWLTCEDAANLLNLSGFEVVKTWGEVLFPVPIPLVDQIFDRFLVKLWPFRLLAITNFILVRPAPSEKPEVPKPSISVIIPARNEAGNIENIFRRVPKMGAGTELIFIEGHSKDDTHREIERMIKKYHDIPSVLLSQEGVGKGDAVRKGFANAHGDVLMILDADLTVSPEDLTRFYQTLVANKGEFINGVRLIYPREKEAMRFLNFLGNKFFSLAFSWLLGQPVKDTLCGTKVLWRRDYQRIAANRSYFGDFDRSEILTCSSGLHVSA